MAVLLIPSSAGLGLGQVQCLAQRILPTVAPVYGFLGFTDMKEKVRMIKMDFLQQSQYAFVLLRWIKGYAFLTLWDGHWLIR